VTNEQTTLSFGVDETLQKALDVGYAYINHRERTAAEVRAQLERKGVDGAMTERAVQTLAEQGMVDDERFATLFVSDKRELEQWGTERIRRGLLARGIDRELAERAIAAGEVIGDGEPPETELDRALALLRRRFPEPPRDRRDRQRALGVLLRKGYESELALDALAAYARGD
jgi:regulatory protein